MNKMKQVIARIEQLEEVVVKLNKLLNIETPSSLDIGLHSINASATFRFKLNPEEIKPFIQARLDLVIAELTPLKERIKLLTELLDGIKV